MCVSSIEKSGWDVRFSVLYMPPDDDAPNKLLKDLYLQREKRGMTFRELAKRAGFANPSVPFKLEREDANPTLRSVMKYAAGLGVRLKVEVESVKRIAFFQYVGGSSKTSVTRDVGYLLSQMGNRVLLVDTDPQASLTSWLGIDKYDVTREQTLLPVAANKGVPLPEPMQVHGMDLIPSTPAFAEAERHLMGGIGPVHRIRDALDAVDGKYDYVLIDSPPSLGQITTASVIAADNVVVPVLAHAKGADGLPTVLDMMDDWQRAVPNLSIAMFIPTQVGDTRVHKQYLEAIREQLVQVAPVSTPLKYRPAIYANATEAKVPVPALKPTPADALAELEAVTRELLEALGVSVDAEA